MIDQVALEADMMRAGDRLDEVTAVLAVRAQEAARAEHAYRVQYAVEFVRARADGQPVAACEALAVIACDLLLIARLEADGLLDSAKEAGRNTRAKGEILRSINSNHRALVTG